MLLPAVALSLVVLGCAAWLPLIAIMASGLGGICPSFDSRGVELVWGFQCCWAILE